MTIYEALKELRENRNKDIIMMLDDTIDSLSDEVVDLNKKITNKTWNIKHEIENNEEYKKLKTEVDELWDKINDLKSKYGKWIDNYTDDHDYIDTYFKIEDEETYNKYKDEVEELEKQAKELNTKANELAKSLSKNPEDDEEIKSWSETKNKLSSRIKLYKKDRETNINKIIDDNLDTIKKICKYLPNLNTYDKDGKYYIGRTRAKLSGNYLSLNINFVWKWYDVDFDDYFDDYGFGDWGFCQKEKATDEMFEELQQNMPVGEDVDTADIFTKEDDGWWRYKDSNVLIDEEPVIETVDGDYNEDEGASIGCAGYISLHIELDD